MAAGDAYVIGPTSIAAGAFLDIQPGSGVEVVIHNVYVPRSHPVEFERWDGSNLISFDASEADGTRYNMQFHCTNANRIRIKNIHASAAAYISADGMVTK